MTANPTLSDLFPCEVYGSILTISKYRLYCNAKFLPQPQKQM